MLSEQEKKKIEEHAAALADRKAVVAEALMTVQESRGWVSDQAVEDVARQLEMSAEEVEGIATFFELVFRRPVGEHVILVCDSVSCWTAGSRRILDHLATTLGIRPGETTKDGRFTLLPAGCLGVCERAPVMMIDREVFGDLTPEKVDSIIAVYTRGKDAHAAH
jgi:NADH-quinone oxidoreductase subunit E